LPKREFFPAIATTISNAFLPATEYFFPHIQFSSWPRHVSGLSRITRQPKRSQVMSQADQTTPETACSRFSALLHEKQDLIFETWIELLRNEYGYEVEQKLATVMEEKQRGQDLFTLLPELLLTARRPLHQFSGMVRKVRTEEYSICDLYAEFFCLEAAIAKTIRSMDIEKGDLLAGDVRLLHQTLGRLFADILKETAMSYEYVVENAKTGVVLTDTEGIITYANAEFAKLAGDEPLLGRRLDHFFRGEEQFTLRNILTGRAAQNFGKMRLDMYNDKGVHIPAGVEFGKYIIDGKHQGGYAHITDITLPIRQQQNVLDEFPYGVIRVNRSGEVKYANPRMLQMVGTATWAERPQTIWDILPDDPHIVDDVKSKLEARFLTGESGHYETYVRAIEGGKQIPVRVSAIAETDLAEERVVASFAIVRSMIPDEMVKDIESIKEEEKLLTAIAKNISLLVPFDLFSVWQYSRDEKNVRLFFENMESVGTQSGRRWWELQPEQVEWLKQTFAQEPAFIGELDEFIEIEEWQDLKTDPITQRYVDDGFRSMLFFPVMSEGKIQAAVCLNSKQSNYYNPGHIEILKDLPIDVAVRVALERMKIRDSKFRLNLIAAIASEQDIYATARLIVDGLVEHFPWDNISLFRVNRDRANIDLICQGSRSDERQIDENSFPQSIQDGILGYVYRTGEAVNVGDIKTHPLGSLYREIITVTRSELCLPLKFGDATWLLNIEDAKENAFSEDEQKTVEWILSGLASALDRLWHHSFMEEALKVMSDAVFVTNTDGRIRQANHAAEVLLKYSQSQLREHSLPQLIANKSPTPVSIRDLVGQKEFTLLASDGQSIPVMLTGSALEKEFAAYIFVAKNMFYHKRLEELEYLGEMYFEIATQVQTPLSLAYNWLSQLKNQDEISNLDDIVDGSLRQLQKVELTYKRLAMYKAGERLSARQPLLIDISEIMSVIRDDMPEAEIAKIDWPEENNVYLEGDLFQLVFCYETILSYLLRFVAQNDKVRIDLRSEEGRLQTAISARFPKVADQTTIFDKTKVAKTLKDMALGEELIENFIKQNGGCYLSPAHLDDRLTFRFDLPQA
jgi:PAS domain S-box-containing protein